MLKNGRFLMIICLFIIGACGNGMRQKENLSQNDLREPLIQENKKSAIEENKLMDKYIERRDWDMKESGTGLRYMVYQEGFGIEAKTGMQATVEYEIALMNGTICYSSSEKGPRTFVIGKDNVETGLHEGITYMKVGDHAKFLVPSYLAHGLIGDQNKIPPRSTLVVDLHLIRLE